MPTLNRVKDIFNKVSLQHISIKEFYYGTSFNVAVSPNTEYPIVFLETPYNINYDDNRRLKNYQFALLVLFKTKEDDIADNHNAQSAAEDIGDAILSKIQNDYKQEILLSGIRALTLNEFSSDTTGGVRYELTVSMNREYSIPVCYADQFDADCTDC